MTEVTIMITLYGFAVSNYYNKIKLALMEKEIAFLEEFIPPSQDDSMLKRSPLGKIPFIESPDGFLSESQAILEYLEDAFPENPLYPANPFERAKCREFIQHLELNIELIARRLYKEALMGGTVSDETKEEVKEKVVSGLKGLARLTKFSPYILGDILSAADVVAWPHFCLIALATQKIYGTDLVAEHIPGVSDYLKTMESRPYVQQVAKDRDAAFKAFLERK
jgi:glutathione S-transferase